MGGTPGYCWAEFAYRSAAVVGRDRTSVCTHRPDLVYCRLEVAVRDPSVSNMVKDDPVVYGKQ